jgi:hypothetical protein
MSVKQLTAATSNSAALHLPVEVIHNKTRSRLQLCGDPPGKRRSDTCGMSKQELQVSIVNQQLPNNLRASL